MATFFYKDHYHNAISPNLTREQKLDLTKRISDLTLRSPIWTNKEKDYAKDFSEIAPHINVKLSGLFLCAILEGILEELGGK